MNTVIITGRVVGSVKSSKFSTSSCFSKFVIEISESKKSKAYVTIAVWGTHAEFARDHLTEGMFVNVYGKLSPRTETNDGVIHNYYEVNALNIALVNVIPTDKNDYVNTPDFTNTVIT